MGPGSPSQPVPCSSCGCDMRGRYIVTIIYSLDGDVHDTGGRFCAKHGAQFSLQIPPGAGPVMIRIFDWQEPDMIIEVRPPCATVIERANVA